MINGKKYEKKKSVERKTLINFFSFLSMYYFFFSPLKIKRATRFGVETIHENLLKNNFHIIRADDNRYDLIRNENVSDATIIVTNAE